MKPGTTYSDTTTSAEDDMRVSEGMRWPEQRPQRQDSLRQQMIDLHMVAARLGMYDAADWLWKVYFRDDDNPSGRA